MVTFYFRVLFAIGMIFTCSQCGITRSVRPIGAGNIGLGASLGGPLFRRLGPIVPIPTTTLYGRYGATDQTDLDFGITIPLVRSLGLSAGINQLVTQQYNAAPALMLAGRMYFFSNPLAWVGLRQQVTGVPYRLEPNFMQELAAIASWQWAPFTWYLGTSLFGPIQQGQIRPNLLTGLQWQFHPQWQLACEGQWQAFFSPSSPLPTSYLGIGGYGALALHLGISFQFGLFSEKI